MLSLEYFEVLGIVSGAIAAFCGAIAGLVMLARMTVRGIRRVFRLMREAAIFLRQVNGDAEHPPMMDVLRSIETTGQDNSTRLANVEKWQADHEIGHAPTGGPIAVPFQRRRKGR